MSLRARQWLVAGLILTVLLVVGVLVVVRGGADPAATPAEPTRSATPAEEPADEPTEDQAAGPGPGGDPDLDIAANVTREDSYYPEMGDPGVDSLHHDLVLAWDPATRVLTGTDTLTFRATADAEEFQLDLGEPLEVSSTLLDGDEVDHEHDGKDLVIEAAVEQGREYVLEVAYAGTPEPVDAPTTREDLPSLGWTITDTGEVWTMQEPYGAFTWYPVNDQPADKALYDFRISTPEPFVGVANGLLEERRTEDGTTATRWHTDEPMSSYLTTIAIGDYEMEEQTTASGVPITLWVPEDKPGAMRRIRYAREAIEWAESTLGPYPFSSAGIVVTDSRSGMETQTMVTLGDNDYVLSKPVIVHELIHQWYGDQVSPTDWRDVWMNEGMTMYLQTIWESEHGGPSLETRMDDYAAADGYLREQAGPPGAYDRATFGEGNIYYIPALMWHELRGRIGEDAFWSMVREWPTVHDNSGATREEYVAWIEETTGEELSQFFADWLTGETTPDRSS